MKKDYLEDVYQLFSGIIFFLVAVLHLLRIIYRWPIVVGNIEIPLFLSYGGLPVSTALTGFAFWLVFRSSTTDDPDDKNERPSA